MINKNKESDEDKLTFLGESKVFLVMYEFLEKWVMWEVQERFI